MTMMRERQEEVKLVATVYLDEGGCFLVEFLSDGTAALSCAHLGVCRGCGREWETGESVVFTPQQAQHLALSLRPLLSAQMFRAIGEALREC